MRHPTRHPVLVALLVTAFALVTAGCGGNGVSQLPKAQAPSSSPTPTDPDVAVAGVDPEDLDVTDTTGSSPGANLSFASPIYSVTAASEPTGPTKVVLKLDNALPRNMPIYVVTRRASSNPWTYLPGRLLSDQRHVEFTTTHLSDFAVLVMDLEGALQSFRDDVRTGIDFSVDRKVDKPECAASVEARKDGYSVVYKKSKKTLSWCFGLENDKRIIRIVNRRVLPVQVTHTNAPEIPPAVSTPKAWTPWDKVVGDSVTLLPPGATATYDADLEPTKHLTISAASDAKARSMQVLQAATDALVGRLSGFGAGERKTVPVLTSLVARPQCAATLGKGSDKMLAACLSRRKMVATFGSRGLLLARITTDPTTKLFLRRQFQTIAQDAKKTSDQNLIVRRAKPNFTAFVGTFSGNVRTMVVSAEGLVVEAVSNAPDEKGAPATRLADITYQLSEPDTEKGVSTAQAVITKIKVYDRKGFKNRRIPKAGDTGTFRIEKGVVKSPFIGRNYCNGKAKKGTCDS
jgi:hypothetical protein